MHLTGTHRKGRIQRCSCPEAILGILMMRGIIGEIPVSRASMSPGIDLMAVSDDRRKRKRVTLHWPVRLFRQPETGAIESTTENLSTAGFYCITSEPFKPGERLHCEIVIPGESLGFSETPVGWNAKSRSGEWSISPSVSGWVAKSRITPSSLASLRQPCDRGPQSREFISTVTHKQTTHASLTR